MEFFERPLKQIALVSSVFVGVSLFGYSLWREHQSKKYQETSFRRHSEDTSSSLSIKGKIPSIHHHHHLQSRIKELNDRARHFAESVLAVRVHDENKSEFQNIESWPLNISEFGLNRCSSCENLPISFSPERTTQLRTEEDLRNVYNLLNDSQFNYRPLSLREAKSLCQLLLSNSSELITKTLISLANAAAFTENQNTLRDADCFIKLHLLLFHPNSEIQVHTLSTIGNLSLNEENQRVMTEIVSGCLDLLKKFERASPTLQNEILKTLTNIAVLSTHHESFVPHFANLCFYATYSDERQTNALRLLINLSVNANLTSSLLKDCRPLWCHILRESSELLRLLTLFLNLFSNISSSSTSLEYFKSNKKILERLKYYSSQTRGEIEEKCLKLHQILCITEI